MSPVAPGGGSAGPTTWLCVHTQREGGLEERGLCYILASSQVLNTSMRGRAALGGQAHELHNTTECPYSCADTSARPGWLRRMRSSRQECGCQLGTCSGHSNHQQNTALCESVGHAQVLESVTVQPRVTRFLLVDGAGAFLVVPVPSWWCRGLANHEG